MASHRRILSRLGLVLLVFVTVFALGELLARRLFPAELPVRFQENEKMLKRIGREQSASVLEVDPELFWRLKPDLVVPETDWPLPGRISNAQGFREDHAIPRAKPRAKCASSSSATRARSGRGCAGKTVS
jgi:hypothetical protein